MIGFSGSFAACTPAITGWSNFNESQFALKNRFRDGDPISSFAWTELCGNVNYFYNQSRRLLWADTFVCSGVSDTNGHKAYTGTDWDALEAIVTYPVRLYLTPNFKRGASEPPELRVKFRTKRGGGTSESHYVRLYTFNSLRDFRRWETKDHTALEYCQCQVTNSAFFDTPGWTPSKDAPTVLEFKITNPRYSVVNRTHPDIGNGGAIEFLQMETYVVLAAIGAAGQSTNVAAIQVMEESGGTGD